MATSRDYKSLCVLLSLLTSTELYEYINDTYADLWFYLCSPCSQFNLIPALLACHCTFLCSTPSKSMFHVLTYVFQQPSHPSLLRIRCSIHQSRTSQPPIPCSPKYCYPFRSIACVGSRFFSCNISERFLWYILVDPYSYGTRSHRHQYFHQQNLFI